MLLYHGSNVSVERPNVLVSNRALDFGPAFYTTSSLEQAARWAQLQARRRQGGIPTVTIYEFDETGAESLNTLRFDGPNKAWLDFVAQNRKANYAGPHFDLIIGPVANDNTMPVISDYMAGSILEETALLLLKPQKLHDQFAFATAFGLSFLSYVEVHRYGQ